MVVILMLEQRVVGVVGLDAAGSRISMPSAKAPGAWLGHEPGDAKGQQRSQADRRDLAMTSAMLWSSSVHDGMPSMACKGSGSIALPWTPADPAPAPGLARGEELVSLLPPCRPPGIAVTSGLHLSRPRPQPCGTTGCAARPGYRSHGR